MGSCRDVFFCRVLPKYCQWGTHLARGELCHLITLCNGFNSVGEKGQTSLEDMVIPIGRTVDVVEETKLNWQQLQGGMYTNGIACCDR